MLKGETSYDTDMHRVGRDADIIAHIEEECPMVDRDLDEDGYISISLHVLDKESIAILERSHGVCMHKKLFILQHDIS